MQRVLGAFLGVLLIVALVFAAGPPAKLLQIEDPGFSKFGPYQKPPVYFSHDIHAREYQISCKCCHHIYKNGHNIWIPDKGVQSCSQCHGKTKQELITAYHMRCWGCHKRIKEVYPKADAPTMQCNRCHIPSNQLSKDGRRIQQKLLHPDKRLMKTIKSLKIKGFYD